MAPHCEININIFKLSLKSCIFVEGNNAGIWWEQEDIISIPLFSFSSITGTHSRTRIHIFNYSPKISRLKFYFSTYTTLRLFNIQQLYSYLS